MRKVRVTQGFYTQESCLNSKVSAKIKHTKKERKKERKRERKKENNKLGIDYEPFKK